MFQECFKNFQNMVMKKNLIVIFLYLCIYLFIYLFVIFFYDQGSSENAMVGNGMCCLLIHV